MQLCPLMTANPHAMFRLLPEPGVAVFHHAHQDLAIISDMCEADHPMNNKVIGEELRPDSSEQVHSPFAAEVVCSHKPQGASPLRPDRNSHVSSQLLPGPSSMDVIYDGLHCAAEAPALQGAASGLGIDSNSLLAPQLLPTPSSMDGTHAEEDGSWLLEMLNLRDGNEDSGLAAMNQDEGAGHSAPLVGPDATS